MLSRLLMVSDQYYGIVAAMSGNFEANSRYLLERGAVARTNLPNGWRVSIEGLDPVTAIYIAFHFMHCAEDLYTGRPGESLKYSPWGDVHKVIERDKDAGDIGLRVFGEYRPASANLSVAVDKRWGGYTVVGDTRNYFHDHPEKEGYKLLQFGLIAALDTIELPFSDPELEELLQ